MKRTIQLLATALVVGLVVWYPASGRISNPGSIDSSAFLQIANNGSDIASTSTFRTNLGFTGGSGITISSTGTISTGQKEFHWSVSGETGVQVDPCIVHFQATSTITSIYAGNKTDGDTVTFNLGYSTGAASNSTSTLSPLFSSNQTVTSTSTPGSLLSVNASSTPGANTCLTYWTSAASSTQFFINGTYTTP